MNNRGVSIIICCYNSEARLKPTLEHIWNQEPLHDASGFEIVLVDNCCTDSTVETAKTLWAAAGCCVDLVIVKEPIPGLSHARIAGVRAARYSTLIFCDDDNWLDSRYCQISHKILDELCDVALVGGRSEGVFETSPPSWFEDIAGAWAIGGSEYQGYLCEPDPFLRGAGLVARKSVFLALLDSGFEFVSVGRKGATLSAGEDSEISAAISATKYRLYFDSRLHLFHWIPTARTTWSYALRLWIGFGAGTIAADPRRIAAHPGQSIRNRFRANVFYQLSLSVIAVTKSYLSVGSRLSEEGNLDVLQHYSKLGRLRGLASIGLAYRAMVLKKAQWLSAAKENVQLNTD